MLERYLPLPRKQLSLMATADGLVPSTRAERPSFRCFGWTVDLGVTQGMRGMEYDLLNMWLAF